METKIIARVNNVNIVSTSDEQMVPIRPICEALGIAYERQTTKIKEHPILSSTVTLRVMVAAMENSGKCCAFHWNLSSVGFLQ